MLELLLFLTRVVCMYQQFKRIPKTYEHINPEEVGNSRNIVVSDQSGQSNIMSRLNSIGIKVEKSNPKIKNF